MSIKTLCKCCSYSLDFDNCIYGLLRVTEIQLCGYLLYSFCRITSYFDCSRRYMCWFMKYIIHKSKETSILLLPFHPYAGNTLYIIFSISVISYHSKTVHRSFHQYVISYRKCGKGKKIQHPDLSHWQLFHTSIKQ